MTGGEGWKLTSWGTAHLASTVHTREVSGSLVTTLCGKTGTARQSGVFAEMGPTRCQQCLRRLRSVVVPESGAVAS